MTFLVCKASVSAGQQFTVPRLQTFMKYARVELAPPSTSDLPQIQKGFNNLVIGAKTQAWRQLSVRVCTETSANVQCARVTFLVLFIMFHNIIEDILFSIKLHKVLAGIEQFSKYQLSFYNIHHLK